MPCADTEQYGCGCADEVCMAAGVDRLRGEDNTRRWLVYEVPPEVAQLLKEQAARSSRGRKRKGAKTRRAPKSEL